MVIIFYLCKQSIISSDLDISDLVRFIHKRSVHQSAQSSLLCCWQEYLNPMIFHKKYLSQQQGKESSVTIKKSFSRPVCPAKRRLPSRWASRSSVSSASSPSPPPTVFTQRQTLTYSTYHTETVI